MALTDVFPDRPLTFNEFQDIQSQDTFDAVLTSDEPGNIDWLFLHQGDTEYTLHYTEESGWHQCGQEELE